MNPCLPDEQTLERMKTAIMAVPPRPHHSTLLQVLSGLLPGIGSAGSFGRTAHGFRAISRVGSRRP